MNRFFQRIPHAHRASRPLAPWRHLLLLVAALTAILATSVALAQSSTNYDFACRGTLTAAGGYSNFPNNNATLISAIGQPIQGFANSANYRVGGGYLQPIVTNRAATTAQLAPASTTQNDLLFLPIVHVVMRVVRAC